MKAAAALQHAGFDTADVGRFVMRVAPVDPPLQYILGRATMRALSDH